MTYETWILAGLAGLALAAVAWRIGSLWVGLHGTRLTTCPETGRTVAVDLDLGYSVVHTALGRNHFRLSDCSRWPERAGCGQMCLGDVEAAPHDCLARQVVARWYAGKTCVYCHREFGELHWHDHAPAVLGADGITRSWKEIAPETLPEVMTTHSPVCWNCHIAETFRREYPDLVVDRPPRPIPPVM
jgi:hypothetical protein